MQNISTNVKIVFSSSQKYAPMLGTALYSLASNSNPERIYDVYILNDRINNELENALSFINKFPNIKLNFIDVSTFFEAQNEVFFTSGYVSKETYYRFFIPQILNKLDKVLYCDCDLIFKTDVGALFDIDLQGKLIGASVNVSAYYNFNVNGTLSNGEKYQDYFNKVLELSQPHGYFQAGVAIFNLDKMRKEGFTDLCLKKLIQVRTPVFFDQDILNSVCQGDVYYFPISWNHTWYFFNFSFLRNAIPLSLYREYEEARKMPKIIHFAGPKPFKDRQRPLAKDFWNVAKNTPFFEFFLKQAYGDSFHRNIVSEDLFSGHCVEPISKSEDSVAILMSSSDSYFHYLGVSVYSILKNSTPSRFYDILVLESSICERNKKILLKFCSDFSNCSLRFINLSNELQQFNDLFYVLHLLSKETYYRLFVDKLLVKYKKIIYLDADTLVTSDLGELFDLDIGCNLIAATRDFVVQSKVKNNLIDGKEKFDYSYYLKNVININYSNYVQCGVSVLNLDEMRHFNFSQKAVDELSIIRTPRFADQDIINSICQDRIYYLDPKYNFLSFYEEPDPCLSLDYVDIINESQSDVKIYHMPGGKPDMKPNSLFASIYFSYARNTPFYELLLKNMDSWIASSECQKHVHCLRKEFLNIHFPNINGHFSDVDDCLKALCVYNSTSFFFFKTILYRMISKLSPFKLQREKARLKYSKFKYIRNVIKKVQLNSWD